jgi:uncharacterized protein
LSINLVLALQRLDIRVQTLSEFLADAPRREADIAAARARAREETETKRQEFDNIKKDLRRQEHTLQDGEEKLKQITAKLNQVKTNKEYEASLREIEEQKKINGRIEEEIIRLFDEVAEADEAIGEIEAELKIKLVEFDALEAELKALVASASTELSGKQAEREAAAALVPDEFMRVYRRLSSFLKRPLARADKEVCLGCHFHIPAQRYNMVLKGQEMIMCPNCQRILVHCETEIEDGLIEILP